MFLDFSFLNSTGFSNLEGFLFFIVNSAISISVVLAVVALVVAGFKFILSFGDDDKRADATRSVLYALIGLVLVFISPTVIEFIIQKVILGE